MDELSPIRSSSTQFWVAVQMAVTHGVAALVALVLVMLMGTAGMPVWVLFGVALGSGGLAGLVLTLNLQHGLQVVESALGRLSDGHSLVSLPRWPWPMGGLMEKIDAVGGRVREYGLKREQLLRQVGETAAQEERNRLARDLHDSIKQQLFSVSAGAATAEARWERDPEGARDALKDVRRGAQEAMVEMQAMLQQLRPAPLDTVGLKEALREQCEALGYRTGARVEAELGELPDDGLLPPGAQESLFRIAQEALSNIARHARATDVRVQLRREGDELLLEIVDDGQGFELEKAHEGMGLQNIRERVTAVNGRLELNSSAGRGTTAKVHIPLFKVESELEAKGVEEETKRWRVEAGLSYAIAGVAGGFAAMLAWLLVLFLREWGGPLYLILYGTMLVGMAAMVGVALYGILRACRAVTEVTLVAGEGSRAAVLIRRQAYRAKMIIFLVYFLVMPVGVAMIGQSPRFPFEGLLLGIATGLMLLFGLLALYQYARLWLEYDRYYEMLSAEELRLELSNNRRALTALLVITAVQIFNLGVNWDRIAFPPRDPGAFFVNLIALMAVWLLILVPAEYWFIRRWEQRVPPAGEA